MDMMETRNGGLIPHFIPSILFILSVALNVVTGQLRWALIICQEVRPGRRPSQKVQPLTGLPVMDMAAAEGESNRRPFRTKAPFSARGR